MKQVVTALVATSIALMVGAVAVQAETVVLDFEDLTGQYEPIPDGYGGIASWGDESAYWTTWDDPDFLFPPHSGVRRCFPFGLGAPIRFGTEYVFDGCWVSGPECAGNWFVWYELYLEGELVYTSETDQPYESPSWFPSGYDLPVDEVQIWSNYNWCPFCMDDFTYTLPVVAAEDATWSQLKAMYR